MTLPSLNSLSSSQLVDGRPKFITTFHSPPQPIWSMIALIITAADCPVALCALPTPSLCRLPQAIHSPLKLYLLIGLSGAITLFSRLMPTGKPKSDLPAAYNAISHWRLHPCFPNDLPLYCFLVFNLYKKNIMWVTYTNKREYNRKGCHLNVN